MSGINHFIFELETISRIKSGDVVMTTSEYINILAPTFACSLDRTIRGDDRSKALTRFENATVFVRDYLILMLESKLLEVEGPARESRISTIVRGLNALKSCIPGLEAFSYTYFMKRDATTSGRVKNLINLVGLYITEIEADMTANGIKTYSHPIYGVVRRD
jgi:hypothetical protein